jgi:DNA-binding NarL/FixJ family response regulator
MPTGFVGPVASRRQRPRLIVADDDAVVRSLLVMSLAEDFEVVGEAIDADGAIELATATRPDAALVDVEMPKGGAQVAVRGIVEVAPEVAIVVLSADESDGLFRELMTAGAVACCPKTIAPEALARTILDSIAVRARPCGYGASSVSTNRGAPPVGEMLELWR